MITSTREDCRSGWTSRLIRPTVGRAGGTSLAGAIDFLKPSLLCRRGKLGTSSLKSTLKFCCAKLCQCGLSPRRHEACNLSACSLPTTGNESDVSSDSEDGCELQPPNPFHCSDRHASPRISAGASPSAGRQGDGE